MRNPGELVISRGRPMPLGATADIDGVNFAIFSENATSIELLLFASHTDRLPFMTVPLDPKQHRTFYLWHVFIKGLRPGVHYAYRVEGPWDLREGHRFNQKKVLIDPYARGNTHTLWNRDDAIGGEKDNVRTSMRSVVIDTTTYSWEGVEPCKAPIKDTIIYEMHVGGFTRSCTSNVKYPGTFRGVIDKIPYLKELGITAVELLPIFDFDDISVFKRLYGTELKNYWGYSTIGFFAPQPSYCRHPEKGNHLSEFRNMVKQLHRAGIEVILDVVFNHTEEGDHRGPTIHFKGLDNSVYYHLEKSKWYYTNFSGCGNAVNCNHPIVSKFITDCLKFWVQEMHVDGFRFDLGSILSRGIDGKPMKYPPVLWEIELSEVFHDTKLIAEAWDAVGLYQVGSFPGYRWCEWNGCYRDDIRRFIKGDKGVVKYVASRIAGSSDIFKNPLEKPINGINFITAHDGFTLMDLVSYNHKHNFANGENNMDGCNQNLSWNCGAEGVTNDPIILKLRRKQIKNFTTTLLLSRGVPMISFGDEVGRSQFGNNNVYCHDNDLSWFDWTLVDENADILYFFRKMIAFRKKYSMLRGDNFFTGKVVNSRNFKDIQWHSNKLDKPQFDDPDSTLLAFTMGAILDSEPDIHVMMNMNWQDIDFEIPPITGGRRWYRVIDTALDCPQDILDTRDAVCLDKPTLYRVQTHAIVVLISK